MVRSYELASDFEAERWKQWRLNGAYRSIFSESHSVGELPLFTVKVLRKLTGIRELPGMMGKLTTF